MRTRMAIMASGQKLELREVVLRDKPAHMVSISPKATVPVLLFENGEVLEESLEIMDWALGLNDPLKLLPQTEDEKAISARLIAQNDGPFKQALDRYKYPNRYDEVDGDEERAKGSAFLIELDERLSETSFLLGEDRRYVDIALLPFVRQFANVDRTWFDDQPWPNILRWLEAGLKAPLFKDTFQKYPQWHEGDAPVYFGAA